MSRAILPSVHKALRWWAFTALAALTAGGLVYHRLRPHPAQVKDYLAPVEIPETWATLPVIARLTGTVITRRDTGWIEGAGHGTLTREGKLGRFTVQWTVALHKGVDAGGRGFSVVDPASIGSCRPLREDPLGTPVELTRPDTLREDAAAGLYVLEGYGRPMAACRRERRVVSPAFEIGNGVRTTATVATLLLALSMSRWVRRRFAIREQ